MHSSDERPLPIDSDSEVEEGAAGSERPVHLHWRFLGLVLVGGAIGAAAREAVGLAIPTINEIPVAIFGVNLLGAFLLGALLEALVRRGPDTGARRSLRLLLGTGVLGGFTTYSTLATDTAALLIGGNALIGVGYALTTVIAGAVATTAGIAAASAVPRRNLGRPRTGEPA